MTKLNGILSLPPFTFQVSSNVDFVSKELQRLYGSRFSHRDNANELPFVDYNLQVNYTSGIRRYVRKQARFMCDNREPFKPLTADHAYAMLEWGMNWAVAAHEVSYVIIHSAVLEKNGAAVVFPAPPGSGKSTLTAYLAMNGWRLLSDEMALIVPSSLKVMPFVRPICLKNKSISLVRDWFPQAVLSRVAKDTHKGDVVHMAPPDSAWQHNTKPATIKAIVFPNYRADTHLDIYALNQREVFSSLSENAFNYATLGKVGFEAVCRLIEQSMGFEIFYNDLAEVKAFLEEDIVC